MDSRLVDATGGGASEGEPRPTRDSIPATLTLEDAAARTWDVVVIGAGPAGSTAARGLADRGADVLLVESRPFPRSKVCGGCLNGQSLSLLSAIGVRERIDALGPVPLHEFRLGTGGRQLSLALPGGLAVSRRAMDAALVKAAMQAGAAFLPETSADVGELVSEACGGSGGEGRKSEVGSRRSVREEASLACTTHHGRSVTLASHGRQIATQARIVVAAAGLGSRCLADGFRNEESPLSRIGVEAMLSDFPAEYAPGVIYMAVGRSGYVGLTRVEDGRLNVAAAVDRRALRASGSPAALCAKIVQDAGFPGPRGMQDAAWHGTIGLTRRAGRRAGERLFLVGDAAGYVEPFTGEGMAWALSSGQGVVPFICDGLAGWRPELAADWEHQYRRLIEHRQWLCRALSLGLRRTWIVRSVFPVLSALPWLARPFIHRLNRELQYVRTDPGPGDRAPCAHHDAGAGAGDVNEHRLPR